MAIDTPYATRDHDAVVAVLVEAFLADPVVRWLFPGEHERRELQPHFYRPLLGHPASEAYLVGNAAGAAVWLTLAAGESAHDEAPEDSDSRLAVLGRALATRHPTTAHVYLPCMGVVAGRQGGGLGSALLTHRLAKADADGEAVYLEASSARSRALYLRHGFADLGEPVRAGDSPPLWPMWREPSDDKGKAHR